MDTNPLPGVSVSVTVSQWRTDWDWVAHSVTECDEWPVMNDHGVMNNIINNTITINIRDTILDHSVSHCLSDSVSVTSEQVTNF